LSDNNIRIFNFKWGYVVEQTGKAFESEVWRRISVRQISQTPERSKENEVSMIIIVWRNRPMWEVIKFRNLKERDCATVAEFCRVLPPLHSFRVLLGYAIITWSRNSKEGQSDLSDVTRNNTQRCVLRVSDSRVDRRD
jgi:hypothetical protein